MNVRMPAKHLSTSRRPAKHTATGKSPDVPANRPPNALLKQFPHYDEVACSFSEQTRQLQGLALQVTARSLAQWVADHVIVDRTELHRWLNAPTGAVFATPHYGPFVGAALMFAHEGRADRPSNIFYDPSESVPQNERFDHLFERFSDQLKVLHNNPRGLINAVRALRKGQCVSIMFDVVQHPANSTFVPFFGKLYPAMGGTAYLSLLAKAPLVPAYMIPEGGQQIRVIFGEPILPEDYASADKEQSSFLMTCALFCDLERQLRMMPWHWIYWGNVRQAPLYDESVLSDDATLRDEFHRRFEAYAQLLTVAPCLKALLEIPTA